MLYANFQLYNERKKRVSIFGEESNGVINITVIPCAKGDTFSKKEARRLYEEIQKDPNYIKGYGIFQIKVPNGEKPKNAFLAWCDNNFRKKMEFFNKPSSVRYVTAEEFRKSTEEMIEKFMQSIFEKQ